MKIFIQPSSLLKMQAIGHSSIFLCEDTSHPFLKLELGKYIFYYSIKVLATDI